jgi:hypothetical protein
VRPIVARIGAVVRGLRPSEITLPLENNAKVERADRVTALVRATEGSSAPTRSPRSPRITPYSEAAPA